MRHLPDTPADVCVGHLAVCFTSGRLKEKNREAQKKYRERQKGKLQVSEDKVSELTEQINALKVEKVSRCTEAGVDTPGIEKQRKLSLLTDIRYMTETTFC